MERKLKRTLEGGIFKNVPPKRSHTMSAIRGKHNRSTELRLRMVLVQAGIKGWITNVQDLPGKPDFFFPKKKIAIFVDGCFWHGCPKCGHYPKTRNKFWKTKILRNKQRDKKNRQLLRKCGIKVINIWEHCLKNSKKASFKIKMLKYLLSV